MKVLLCAQCIHSPTIYAVKQASLAQNVAIWKEQMDTCHEVVVTSRNQ